MSAPKYLAAYLFSILTMLGCRNENNFIGNWRPIKVTYWIRAPKDGDVINLKTRQVDFDRSDAVMVKIMTPKHKDSLLKTLSISYLKIKDDGSFAMEDHGYFSYPISDTTWQNFKVGKWKLNRIDSVLKLSQANGLDKCYKLLKSKKDTLIMGELFDCNFDPPLKNRPMTEIILVR
jgi:hypothetical protein